MKYCTKCGNELMDEAVFCPSCGCAVEEPSVQKGNNGLQSAAKVFMIIGTVLMAIFVLPLAWCIPMTVIYCDKIKNNQPVSVGFKVCCLLFVSLVGGILMLCDNE